MNSSIRIAATQCCLGTWFACLRNIRVDTLHKGDDDDDDDNNNNNNNNNNLCYLNAVLMFGSSSLVGSY
jgi:hypothetical protein